MSAYRGWGLRIKLQQRELPRFFFQAVNTLKDFCTGIWILFCGAGVYEPRLARDSSPCGVASTQEKSVFVPGLLELMEYGRISGTGVEPFFHRVRRNAPPPLAGLHPPGVSLALRAAQPIDDKPM